MTVLRAQEGVAARAFEFLILTAARTGEIMGMRWREIDFNNKLWVVPSERMKAGKEHRVPLCSRAVAILQAIKPDNVDVDGFVFPGSKSQKPQSTMAFLMLLRRMKFGELTAHGFRATFKTWATERTNFQREVVEAALAHVAGDKIEAAYQRGDLFDKRHRLMNAWADYCRTNPASESGVVSIRSGITSDYLELNLLKSSKQTKQPAGPQTLQPEELARELWKKLVNRVGKLQAKEIMRYVMGGKKPGPRNTDQGNILTCFIYTYIRHWGLDQSMKNCKAYF